MNRLSPSVTSSSRQAIFTSGAVLIVATVAAYHNCFSVPFLYDDIPAIVRNTTIRELSPLSTVFSPPADTTTSGRPLLNLSLALNYALSGTHVGSYHVINLLIHALSGLTLFGIVRRTLGSKPLHAHFAAASLPLALCVAALWTLHPLQTESVTYIVQRAESLMGLLYLLTLYCFMRATGNYSRRTWLGASFLFCLLGMASKEVMVSAPLMVLLYDRTFIAGSFREAWQRRRLFYLSLVATWVVLGYLVFITGTRSGSAGFGAGISAWTYLLTQARAIVLYLQLSFWPSPLVFDYGIVTTKNLQEVLPHALLIVALGIATIIGLRRWAALGFLGFWFFAILAPSSSIVPVVTETIAEHRMYLPLAAVMTLAVLAAYARLGKRVLPVFLVIAIVFGGLTVVRNRAYASELALWTDTVEKRPENPRAHNQLGNILVAAGREDEAFAHFQEALRLKPTDADGHYNVATAFLRRRQPDDALAHFQEALRLNPKHADSHTNYGLVLMQMGRPQDAIAPLEESLRLRPGNDATHNNLGIALAQTGRIEAALEHFATAAKIRPSFAEAQNNWGNALRQTGRLDEALLRFQHALALAPDYAEAHNNLALTFDALERWTDAASHYEQVLRLEPTYADGHYNLANVLLRLARREQALAHLEETVRLQPDHVAAAQRLRELRAP